MAPLAEKLMKWTAMMLLSWHITTHISKREVTVCYTHQKNLKSTLVSMARLRATHFMLRRVKCRQIICRATHLEKSVVYMRHLMSMAKIGATLITAMRWSLKLKKILLMRMPLLNLLKSIVTAPRTKTFPWYIFCRIIPGKCSARCRQQNRV